MLISVKGPGFIPGFFYIISERNTMKKTFSLALMAQFIP